MSEFYIQQKDWRKIINYATAREQECGDEIGGMAIARQDEDKDWIISHPTILKQKTTGGTCTLDKDELAQYYSDMAAKFGTNIQFVWWHSHAKMGAFWSGTDTSTMKEYASGDWSMFLVVNVREEYKFRVQYWNPIELGEDIELNVVTKDKERVIPKSILKEIENKCEEEHKISKNGYGYSYKTYLRNNSQSNLFNHTKANKDSDKDDLMSSIDLVCTGGAVTYGHQVDIQEDPIIYLHEQLDMGNSNYCDGSINYTQYKKAVYEFNKTLKALEGVNTPKIRVKLYSESKLLDKCMTLNPIEFITIDNKSAYDLYLESLTEDAEVKDRNNSFREGV